MRTMRPLYLQSLSPDSETTFLGTIPEGRDGTFATLRLMAAIVRAWKRDPSMRELALSLTRGLPPKDWRAEADALFRFVRDRIRYVLDVSDLETLHTPDVILRQGAGDCDDKSILLATLLESIGHKTKFVAMAWDSGFEHVSVETRIGSVWVNCETTENVEMGWAPNPPPLDTLPVFN